MDNKEIVTEFFRQVTNGNMQKAFELVDDNVSWWIPGSLPFSGTKQNNNISRWSALFRKDFQLVSVL